MGKLAPVSQKEKEESKTNVEQKAPQTGGFSLTGSFGNQAMLGMQGSHQDPGFFLPELGNSALLAMRGSQAIRARRPNLNVQEPESKSKSSSLIGLGEVTLGLLTLGIWPLVKCIFNAIVSDKKGPQEVKEGQQLLQQAKETDPTDPNAVHSLVIGAKQAGIGEEDILRQEQNGEGNDQDAPILEQEAVEQQANKDETSIAGDRSKVPLLYEIASGEDKDNPPAVEVQVKQSTKGEKVAQKKRDDDCGHTFLVLRYTRYSRALGRRQRYRTTFGFYPKVPFEYSDSLGAHATMPGMIVDDNWHDSDIGKTFPVTNEEINKIITATPSYPDKGYNLISRNCTTFAADMTNLSGLDTGGIFQNEDWDIGGLGFLLPGAQIQAILNKKQLRKRITDRMKDQDLSFESEGKARVTESDLENYDKSLDYGHINIKGYSPSVVGERMRSSSSGGFVSRHDSEEMMLEMQAGNFKKAVNIYLEKEQKLHSKRGLPEINETALADAMHCIDVIAPMLEDMTHKYKYYKGLCSGGDHIKERDLINELAEKSINSITGVSRAASAWMRDYSAIFPYIAMPVLDLIGNCTRLSEKVSDDAYDLQSLDVSTEYGSLLGGIVGSPAPGKSSPLAMLAFDRAFGGRENALKARKRITELNDKDELDPGERSELRKLQIRQNNISKIMVVEMARFDKSTMDQGDMDFMFGILPGLKSGGKVDKDSAKDIGISSGGTLKNDDYSSRYQIFALNQVFGGLGTIKEKIDQRTKENRIGNSIDDYSAAAIGFIMENCIDGLKANSNMMAMIVKALVKTYSQPGSSDSASRDEIVAIAMNRILKLYYSARSSEFGFTGGSAFSLDKQLDNLINVPNFINPEWYAPELYDLLIEAADNLGLLKSKLLAMTEEAISSLR